LLPGCCLLAASFDKAAKFIHVTALSREFYDLADGVLVTACSQTEHREKATVVSCRVSFFRVHAGGPVAGEKLVNRVGNGLFAAKVGSDVAGLDGPDLDSGH
jgi:hypothetical protein